ncbi:hypothetical protein Tco_0315981 [Tanacetum coccineum]
MMGTKSDIEKFNGKNDFALWQVRMKALLEQQGLAAALEELPAATIAVYDNVIQKEALCALILCLGDRVLWEITKETTATGIWKKLETLYMTKSLANHLYLKKKLYTFQMHQGKSQSKHIDEFQKLVGDLAAIDTAISDEDQALLLLTSLPSSYDNFLETLLYGRDTLKLEDVLTTLISRELQKMTKAKGDGGEGLYVRGDLVIEIWSMVQIVRDQSLRTEAADSAMGVEELLEWIMYSGGSYHITYRRDYLVDFEEYDSGNILLSDGRECLVQGTCKVQVQMADGSSFVLDNVRSTQQCTKSEIAKHLGVAGLQQQNGLVEETNMTLLAKVRYFLIQSGLSKVLWAEDTTIIKQGMLKPVKVKCIFLGYRKGIVGNKLWRLDDVTSKVVLYRNMGFNESREYKKTFIGSGVVGSQEVQTHDLIYYHSAHDREQHSVWELFSYREDNNENTFAVAAVVKTYAHESLTFNDTVACEVISKWKTGLKEEMDARSDVFYNGKLVQTLLDGHFILSLEGSLSGDCDVEKNGKWSCIYVVGSQEYQVVCTRLDIASAAVALSPTEAGYMTLTEAENEAIGLKGLAIESRFELKIVAVLL